MVHSFGWLSEHGNTRIKHKVDDLEMSSKPKRARYADDVASSSTSGGGIALDTFISII